MSDLHNVPFSYSIINFTPKKKKSAKKTLTMKCTISASPQFNDIYIQMGQVLHNQYSKNHKHYNFIIPVKKQTQNINKKERKQLKESIDSR